MSKEKQYIRKIWRAIKYRTAENYFQKHLYYDKGVIVCELWLNNYSSFESWALFNGLKKGTHIDRIDSNGCYEPNNCRVVTPIENANNKKNTFFVDYKGEKVAYHILLRKLNKIDSSRTIRRRIERGWTHTRAIDTPIRKGNWKTT